MFGNQRNQRYKGKDQIQIDLQRTISSNIEKNLEDIQQVYTFPSNQDFKIRPVYISAIKQKAIICYIDGIVNESLIEEQVIRPLQTYQNVEINDIVVDLCEKVIEPRNVKVVNKLDDVIRAINVGFSALLINGIDQVILLPSGSYHQRSVDIPRNETVVSGPHEAFIENGQINRSLIRKQLRSEHLVSESIIIGTETHSDISMMYMKNIVDLDLVEAVRKRINEIKIDNVQDLGLLEQHLEERPYSLVPTVLLTERPDRAVSFLLEGHVVLIHNYSPFALVVPVTFWDLFHTSEDSYLRLTYGNFIRMLRMTAILIAISLSPLYVALANYHNEMIPTDLMFAIAGTRETIPLPAVVEIFLMEFAFELIREAGVRVPSPMGQMIGIVGALILGQAAVQANVVSPILIIVVALGGVASFAIPNNNLGYMIRISKFILFFFAAFLGLYGLALSVVLYLAYLISIKSFDVPFLAPVAPFFKGPRDAFFRTVIWKDWNRPSHLNPKNKKRADKPEGNQRQ